MKKILRYLWFVLCTVSYSSAYANTCDIDPNECTPKSLCAAATSQKNGNTIWSDASAASKHVSLAKELGINCDVVEIVDPCDVDANECKISQLCQKATLEFDGVKRWNDAAQTYVELAKAYGLGCDVVANCSLRNQTACSNEALLCELATELGTWKTNLFFVQYVSEAKRRGLNCGVKETQKCSLPHQQACEDKAILCMTAVVHGKWATHPAYVPYVLEAKRQGLSCVAQKKATAPKIKTSRPNIKTPSEIAIEASLITCSSGDLSDNCTNTYSNKSGNKWIGRRANGGLHGTVTYLHLEEDKWKGDVGIGQRNNNEWYGPHLYVWSGGNARFDLERPLGNYTANSTVYWVFPELRRMFMALSKQERLMAQRSMAQKNLYGSMINGAWGRETLIGLGRFSAEHLNTINLKSERNIQLVLDGLLAQVYENRTKMAPLATLEKVAKRDAEFAKAASSSSKIQNNCEEDVKLCSQSKVCNLATVIRNGLRYWDTNVRFTNYVLEAKRRGLTCGVVNTGRLPDCPSSGSRHNCFGTYDWEDGAKYVGEWKNGKRHGQGSYIYSSGDISIGEWIDSEIKGETVYIWKTGQALFEPNWKPNKDYTSDSTVQKMFPYLVRQLNSFSKYNRKELQRSLQRKGLYSSTVDGQWGRNTLIGFARFSSEYMRTVNLKDHSTVDAVINAIYKQRNLSKVQPASKSLLDSIAAKKNKAAKVLANVYQLENSFKELASTPRKQVQWSLRELGYYKSSIDGLWGAGTLNGLTNYSNAHGLTSSSPRQIFNSLLNKVDAPKSFHVPNKKTVSNNRQSSGCVSIASALTGIDALCSKNPIRPIFQDSDGDDNSSTRSRSSRPFQCSVDSQCGFNKKCVRRNGKSACVSLVDEDGRGVRSRGNEIQQCRRNSDCTGRRFKCDRQLKICVKK